LNVELLAPVGDMAMCQAAVHNGADAIYVGVPEWNARGRSADLTLEDLRAMIAFCRLRNVKVYFALNVLVFERELEALSKDIAAWVALAPDAFIVQDLGLVRLIHAVSPDQEIHASTQMTLASPEAVRLAAELGVARCVLARELSLAQIRRIHEAVPAMELEVFVHGALCVSYSGQCLTSESFGGRSANRGQCAQSCRLPYKLIVDGVPKPLQGRDYLFSPQDLCALDVVPDLVRAGVSSLKIEGRLKSPEYVAAVTAAYRAALDTGKVPAHTRTAIEALFSRGLFTGWLQGVNHQQLVNGFFSSHYGSFLGAVVKNAPHSIWVRTAVECQAGDGVVLVLPDQDRKIGGRLYGVSREGPLLRLDFAHDLDLHHVNTQFQVYRNDSPAIEKEVRRTFTEKERNRRIPVQIELIGQVQTPLQLCITDSNGHKICVASPEPLALARTPRATQDKLATECAALAATAYQCETPIVRVDPAAFVAEKMVRALRQEAVAALDALRLAWKDLHISAARGEALFASVTPKLLNPKIPELSVLVRRVEQLEGLAGLPLENVVLDLDYGKDLGEGLRRVRALGLRAGLATLRIHKAGENYTLRTIRDLHPDLVLVRSLGALAFLRDSGLELRGDYSLNTCNRLTLDWLHAQGLASVHPAWDLNQEQLFDLARACGGQFLEVALHQYMPTFHMEHCVFAAFLTTGEKFPFCGRVCEHHQVEVMDHKGERHFLESDAECRNTLFNGRPQSALQLYPGLRQLGVERFRVELLTETPDQVRRKVQTYCDVLAGHMAIADALQKLGVDEKYGVSAGQLFNGSRWKDRKKEAKGS
jgi:U32 family peptidase